MKPSLVAALAIVATLLGAASAVLGGELAVVGSLALVAIGFVFVDYRVGIVCLAFLLPWTASPLLPQAKGLNIINYLTAASLISFMLRAALVRKVVWPPKALLLLYILPFLLGGIIALPYLPEGARNFSGTDAALQFDQMEFIKGYVLKPLGYVVFAFLLANAVRDSSRPERFLYCFIAAGVVPALATFGLIAVNMVPLSELQAQRDFMKPLGLHANEMAILLAFVAGPLTFMLPAWSQFAARMLGATALLLVAVALLLTFSRGGMLALFVIIFLFIWRQRRLSVALGVVVVSVTGLLLLPAAFKERASTGLTSDAIQYSIGNLSDPLTAGRVAVWQRLWPEVERSPIWGKGIASTAWSDLVRSGVYRSVHPHNLYLALLMDLGVLGLAAMLCWYFYILRTQERLRKDAALSPLMRAFFSGASAALIGVLVMSVTNGYYGPRPDYSFFWFSLGITFAFWRPLNRHISVESPSQTQR